MADDALVRISEEHHKQLQAIADLNRRTLKAQLEMLIERAHYETFRVERETKNPAR